MELLIYLASPYSHQSVAVRRARVRSICRAAAALIRCGYVVFSPVAHSHGISQHGLPVTWEFWEHQDRRFLTLCDELWVLQLEGWRQSRGVQAEIALACSMGKPVRFVNMDEVLELERKSYAKA